MVTQQTAKPKGEISRKKLLVISVDEIKSVGDKGAKKLPFKASDESGQHYLYFTFKTDLFETIQKSVDASIDCEIETSQREYDGNIYTDRKVTQIFVGGEPVAQKKSFGGYRGRSPEEVASIETQCAMKMVCELTISGKINTESPLYGRLLHWLNIKTAGFDLTPAQPVPATSQPTQPKAQAQPQQAEEKHLPTRRMFGTLQQFLTAASSELHLTTTKICFALKINNVSEIKDFEDAWMILTGKKTVK